jgi:hypothetical protein
MYSPDYFKNPIKLNRPLNAEERETHLPQTEQQPDFSEKVPHYQLSVLEHNSTYMELVDINHRVRGIGTFISLVGMGLTGFIIWVLCDPKQFSWVEDGLFIALMPFPSFLACLYIFLKESFAYTHYPVRLNRKNRTVYVWRKKGVLAVPWDKLHFWLRSYRDMGCTVWDIRANVLAEDGTTVIDSFPFGGDDGEQYESRLHFEYFRRYMEEGPKQTYNMLKVCLAVSRRKETWFEGYERTALNMGGSILVQILFCWWFIPISITRFIAMRTSKIPQWPEWVEQECKIDPKDPYVREAGYLYQPKKK